MKQLPDHADLEDDEISEREEKPKPGQGIKRASSTAVNKATPAKKARKQALKIIPLDSDSSSEEDDLTTPAPPVARSVSARNAKKAAEAPAIDNVVLPLSTLPAAISFDLPAVPAQSLPLVVEPLPSLATPSPSYTATTSTCRPSDGVSLQNPSIASSFSDPDVAFRMYSGMVFENMKSQMKVKALERQVEIYAEMEEKSAFQDNMLAFFNVSRK